ncbi:MAG TPA: hypothetical protein PKV53_01080, partial [Anaerohalosphaeraceae bacterium]|nr:hypothetical protein [Anaerohalosphaeraceae bacterium]
VEDVCDRIGILYGGRMQVEGTVRQLLQQSDETQIRTGRLSEAAIEQIRRIAASEGQVPEITNPMDKLENFFIRIVAKARQEKQRTSGAEVGTGIQGFLAEKPVVRPESVLQQLVAANVTAPAAPQGPQAAVTKPAPQPQPAAADRDLLGKLVQPVDAGVSQTAVETVQPASAPEKQDAVKRDVLEELIGKKRDGSTQLTQPVKAEDSKNA